MRHVMMLKLALAFMVSTSFLVPLLVLLPRERSMKFTDLLILTRRPPCAAMEPWIANSPQTEFISRSAANRSRSSCISRMEHASYRKPSQVFNVPPKLAQALAEYERMHSRCYHAKDLVHFESDGLGNRLVGLISTFIYALLTNRVFLVDPRGQSSKLLCEPFRNSSWLLPEDFPINLLDQAPALVDSADLNQLKIVHIWLTSVRRDLMFLTRQIRSELQPVTWIVMSSNLYFVPRMFTFPEFWNTLINLFPDATLAVTHLARYLLLPQDHIWSSIVRYQSTYLATRGARLGVQIRLHKREDPGEFHQPTYERIMQCLLGNGLLPMLSRSITKEEVASTPSNTTLVFVASLQRRYYEELKQAYVRNPTGDGSMVQFHTFSHDGEQTETIQQAENALAEMWLLSFSDTLVTSSSSTFGYIAQGLAGQAPYILNIKSDDLTRCELPPCSLRLSAAPCNHQPYFTGEEERERSRGLKRWMKTHVTRCQDNVHGIQLV